MKLIIFISAWQRGQESGLYTEVALCLPIWASAAYAPRLAQSYPKKVEETLLGALTQFAKQFPLILEEPPQDFWHAEHVLPVGYRVQDIHLQMAPELDYFFGMTRWAETAAPAAERQQVLMVAVRAAHPGEALVQITALKILADDPRNDGT